MSACVFLQSSTAKQSRQELSLLPAHIPVINSAFVPAVTAAPTWNEEVEWISWWIKSVQAY
ncbi:MAG: hypothetical protein A2030_05315 [Chloroflexi bacterium RBG_19FT_COMBO_50_10]|nr:MAG: hypothetical protein A2030_05315 [Chloroflexi bacterium RBG_19FT_COMBO_50_10]